MNPVSALRRFAGLRSQPRPMIELLAAGFVEREVAAGEVLLRQGGRASSLVLILDGVLSLVAASDGVARSRLVLGPGDVAGHIALYCGDREPATCRAIGPARVAELGAPAFSLLTNARAEIAYAFERAIAEQVAADTRALLVSGDEPVRTAPRPAELVRLVRVAG